MNLNKFIDLLFRPDPPCREKPLTKGIMAVVILGLLAVVFLLWITR